MSGPRVPSEVRNPETVRRNREGIRNMLVRFTTEGWTGTERGAADDWIRDTFDALCDSHDRLTAAITALSPRTYESLAQDGGIPLYPAEREAMSTLAALAKELGEEQR